MPELKDTLGFPLVGKEKNKVLKPKESVGNGVCKYDLPLPVFGLANDRNYSHQLSGILEKFCSRP